MSFNLDTITTTRKFDDDYIKSLGLSEKFLAPQHPFWRIEGNLAKFLPTNLFQKTLAPRRDDGENIPLCFLHPFPAFPCRINFEDQMGNKPLRPPPLYTIHPLSTLDNHPPTNTNITSRIIKNQRQTCSGSIECLGKSHPRRVVSQILDLAIDKRCAVTNSLLEFTGLVRSWCATNPINPIEEDFFFNFGTN